MKKILSCLLCILMLASTVPITEAQSPAISYKVNDDGISVTVTGADSSAESLEIPEAIEGYPVTAIAANAFSGCTALRL